MDITPKFVDITNFRAALEVEEFFKHSRSLYNGLEKSCCVDCCIQDNGVCCSYKKEFEPNEATIVNFGSENDA